MRATSTRELRPGKSRVQRTLRAATVPALLVLSCVAATSLYWQGHLANALSFEQAIEALDQSDEPNRIRAAGVKARRLIVEALDSLERAGGRVPDASDSIDAILSQIEATAREKAR